PAHEPFERRERTARQQLQIGELSGGQGKQLEVLDRVGPLSRPVDEHAAMGRDQASVRIDDHAVTAAGTRPRASKSSTIRCALASGSSCSDSMQTSGLAGASYGSETPVNSLISPRKAFS